MTKRAMATTVARSVPERAGGVRQWFTARAGARRVLADHRLQTERPRPYSWARTPNPSLQLRGALDLGGVLAPPTDRSRLTRSAHLERADPATRLNSRFPHDQPVLRPPAQRQDLQAEPELSGPRTAGQLGDRCAQSRFGTPDPGNMCRVPSRRAMVLRTAEQQVGVSIAGHVAGHERTGPQALRRDPEGVPARCGGNCQGSWDQSAGAPMEHHDATVAGLRARRGREVVPTVPVEVRENWLPQVGVSGEPKGLRAEELASTGLQPGGAAQDYVDPGARLIQLDVARHQEVRVELDNDDEVVAAVTVDIPRSQGRTELLVAGGHAGQAVAALPDGRSTAGCQPGGRPTEHHHGPCVRESADVLAGDPDREVGEAVCVEVAADQRIAEPVVRLVLSWHPGLALVPDLVTGRRQAFWTAIEDLDGPHRWPAPDAFAWDPDREVGEPVGVEVAGGQHGAEAVALLQGSLDALAALVPELVVVRDPGGRAVQDLDRAGSPLAPQALPRDADRQVGIPVPVEVEGDRNRLRGRCCPDPHPDRRDHRGQTPSQNKCCTRLVRPFRRSLHSHPLRAARQPRSWHRKGQA